MKYLIFLILIFTTSTFLYGQNLIRNGGFEQGYIGNVLAPNDQGEADKARFWDSDEQAPPFSDDAVAHSPDWFFNEGNHTILEDRLTPIQAHSGSAFVGMGGAEMLQQHLQNNIDTDKSHKLEMYIYLPNSSFLFMQNPTFSYDPVANWPTPNPFEWSYERTIYLDVFYSKSQMRYKNNDLGRCDEDLWEKKTNGQPILVKRIPLSLSRYGVNEWIKIETYLDPISESGYDWVNFEISNYSSGILMDDIKILELSCDECDNCSKYDGCLNLSVNAVHTEAGQCATIFGLGNVSHFEMDILRVSDAVTIRSYEIENPPSIFCWDGKDDGGNIISNHGVSSAAFFLKIKVKNNCQAAEYTVAMQFWGDEADQCTCSGSIDDTSTPLIPDRQCCDDDLFLNHLIIDEDVIYRANRIFVGPNVIIKSGATVVFNAKVEIDISPDFKAEQGADWLAYLDENCVEDDFGKIILISNDSTISNVPILDKSNNNENVIVKPIPEVNVYPNPTNGIINIVLSNVRNNAYLQVYNVSGRLLKTRILVAKQTTLDLSNYPKGVYFIRIQQDDEIITKKIVIQ
jgi:hypothetical protein